MPPKFPKGNVRLMTDEDLDGFTLDQLKCRACSGYGNCGYKQMNIYNGKAVSICQMRKKKLQCERDGVPFEMSPHGWASRQAGPICVDGMKNARGYRACIDLAEEVGFEPTEPCGSTVFKTAAFNHSAIPPARPDYIRCLIGAAPSVGILQVSFVRASRRCLVLRPSRSFQPLSKRKLPIHSSSICPFGKFCFTRLKFVVSCKMRI